MFPWQQNSHGSHYFLLGYRRPGRGIRQSINPRLCGIYNTFTMNALRGFWHFEVALRIKAEADFLVPYAVLVAPQQCIHVISRSQKQAETTSSGGYLKYEVRDVRLSRTERHAHWRGRQAQRGQHSAFACGLSIDVPRGVLQANFATIRRERPITAVGRNCCGIEPCLQLDHHELAVSGDLLRLRAYACHRLYAANRIRHVAINFAEILPPTHGQFYLATHQGKPQQDSAVAEKQNKSGDPSQA